MAFSTTGISGGASLTSEINVTRLIDVLLVMLIIFMVIAPVMPRGLNSALPSASTPLEGAGHLVVGRWSTQIDRSSFVGCRVRVRQHLPGA
jgi:biopolymer transport protein ExbD